MAKGSYTIQGPTGEQVSFEWGAERDPSDQEMQAILSHALGSYGKPPAPLPGPLGDAGRAGPGAEGGYDPAGSQPGLLEHGLDFADQGMELLTTPKTMLDASAQTIANTPIIMQGNTPEEKESIYKGLDYQDRAKGVDESGLATGGTIGSRIEENFPEAGPQALGMPPEARPFTRPVVKTILDAGTDPVMHGALQPELTVVSKGITALFGAQSSYGTMQALAQAADAAKRGDYKGALEAFTNAGINAAFAMTLVGELQSGKSVRDVLADATVYGPPRPPEMHGPPAPMEFPEAGKVQTPGGQIVTSPSAKGQLMMPFDAFEPKQTPPEQTMPSGEMEKALENQLGQTRKNRGVRAQSARDITGLGGPPGIEGEFYAADKRTPRYTPQDLVAGTARFGEVQNQNPLNLPPGFGEDERGSTPIFSDIARGILKLVKGDDGVVEIGGKRGGRAFHGTDNTFTHYSDDMYGQGGGGDSFGRGVYLTDTTPFAKGFGDIVRNQIIPRGTKLLNLGVDGQSIITSLVNHLESKMPGLGLKLHTENFAQHWDTRATPQERYEALMQTLGDYLKEQDPHLRSALEISKTTKIPEYKGPGPDAHGAAHADWWDHLTNWRESHPELNRARDEFGGKSVNDVVQEKHQDIDLYVGKLLQKSGVDGLFYQGNQTMKLNGLPPGNNVVLFSPDLLNAARKPGGHYERLAQARKAGDITAQEFRENVAMERAAERIAARMKNPKDIVMFMLRDYPSIFKDTALIAKIKAGRALGTFEEFKEHLADEQLPKDVLHKAWLGVRASMYQPSKEENTGPNAGPDYYSNLHGAITGLKGGEKLHGPSTLNQLRKMPGVTAEELKASGVEDHLTNTPKTTKGDVLAVLDKGTPKLEDTRFDDRPGENPKAWHRDDAQVAEIQTRYQAQELERDAAFSNLTERLKKDFEEASPTDTHQYDQIINQVIGEIHSDVANRFGERYHAPGNFAERIFQREHLHDPGMQDVITHVLRRNWSSMLEASRLRHEHYQTARALDDARHGPSESWDNNRNPNETRWKGMELTAGNGYEENLQKLPMSEVGQDSFDHPHWDGHTNVLLHERYGNETDTDGKSGIMLDEMQSDWHQKGQKHGYRTPEYIKDERRLVEIERSIQKLAEEKAHLSSQRPLDAIQNRVIEINREMLQLNHEHSALYDKYALERGRGEPVPDAPFKKDEQWTALGLKKMIRIAAEKGAERLYWPSTPEQVAKIERWGKVKTENPGWWLPARILEGSNGVVPSGPYETRAEAINALNRYYGYEENSANYPKLEVTHQTSMQYKLEGGRNVTPIVNRYLELLPRLARDLGKKFGAEVGKTTIIGEKNLAASNLDAWAELAGHGTNPAPKETVWYMDIPPKLRYGAIKEGLPLYGQPTKVPKLQMQPPPGTPEFAEYMANPERGAVFLSDVRKKKEPFKPGQKKNTFLNKLYEAYSSNLLAGKVLATKIGSDATMAIEHPLLRGVSAGMERGPGQLFEKGSQLLYGNIASMLDRSGVSHAVFGKEVSPLIDNLALRRTVERHFEEFPAHFQALVDPETTALLGVALHKGWAEERFDLNPHSKMEHDLTGTFGKVVRTIPRAMGAITNVAGQAAAATELRAIGIREANAQGLEGARKADYIKTLIRTPFEKLPEHVQNQLVKVAMEKTLLANMGKLGQSINAMRLAMPGGRWISPFFQIGSNIVKGAYERSPAVLPELVHKTALGELKGGQVSDALAKATLGTALGVVFLQMAKAGLSTGGGPVGIARKLNREDTKALPNAFHLMHQWITRDPLGPLARIANLAADYVEAGQEKDQKNIARKYKESIMENLSPLFLKDAYSLMEVMYGDSANMQQNMQRFIGNEAAGLLVPRPVANIAEATDVNPANHNQTWVRRAGGEDFWGGVGSYIKKDIPGLRQDLPIARSGTGRQIYKDRFPGENIMSPLQRSVEEPGRELEKELDRIESPPLGAPRNVEVATEFGKVRVALTQDERDQILKGGKTAAKILNELIADPGWKDYPSGIKKQIAAKVFAKVRKMEEGRLMTTLQGRAAEQLKKGLPQQEP